MMLRYQPDTSDRNHDAGRHHGCISGMWKVGCNKIAMQRQEDSRYEDARYEVMIIVPAVSRYLDIECCLLDIGLRVTLVSGFLWL